MIYPSLCHKVIKIWMAFVTSINRLLKKPLTARGEERVVAIVGEQRDFLLSHGVAARRIGCGRFHLIR